MNLSCLYKAFCACCCLSERCIQAQLPGVPMLMNPDLKLATVAEELKKVDDKIKDQIKDQVDIVVEELKDICLNPEKVVMENLTEILTQEEEGKKSLEGLGEKLTTKPFKSYIKSYFS